MIFRSVIYTLLVGDWYLLRPARSRSHVPTGRIADIEKGSMALYYPCHGMVELLGIETPDPRRVFCTSYMVVWCYSSQSLPPFKTNTPKQCPSVSNDTTTWNWDPFCPQPIDEVHTIRDLQYEVQLETLWFGIQTYDHMIYENMVHQKPASEINNNQ